MYCNVTIGAFPTTSRQSADLTRPLWFSGGRHPVDDFSSTFSLLPLCLNNLSLSLCVCVCVCVKDGGFSMNGLQCPITMIQLARQFSGKGYRSLLTSLWNSHGGRRELTSTCVLWSSYIFQVCMCVCMYVCMYVCIYLPIYLDTHTNKQSKQNNFAMACNELGCGFVVECMECLSSTFKNLSSIPSTANQTNKEQEERPRKYLLSFAMWDALRMFTPWIYESGSHQTLHLSMPWS